MAYEWKHQKGIPIVGIENDALYDLATDLWLEQRINGPKSVYFQFKYADGSTYDMTTNDVLGFVLRARNKSMANTLIEKCKTHDNPILFVGGGHVLDDHYDSADVTTAQDYKWNFRMVQTFLIGKLQPFRFNGMECEAGLWGRLSPNEIRDYENMGIAGYLEKEKVGYVEIINVVPDKQGVSSTYDRLFMVQSKGGYKEYVDWLISERGARRGVTTVRPSPEAAAMLVNALKGLKDKKPFVVGIGDSQSDAKFYKEQQHGDTCAVVAQEEIIHKLKGFDPGEETLRQEAEKRGWYESGVGTDPDHLGNLLELYGIPVKRYDNDATLDDLKRELEQGHKVIAGVNADILWYNTSVRDRAHAIWVTGLELNKEGRIVSVVINDSGNKKIDGGGSVD